MRNAMFWSALRRKETGASFSPVERRLLFVVTLLFAQQMAARAQLEQMRRALPAPGGLGRPGAEPQPGGPEHPTGQYL